MNIELIDLDKYNPSETHSMYKFDQRLPSFSEEEAKIRCLAFYAMGYSPVSSVVLSDAESDSSLLRVLDLHGKAEHLLDQGVLLGPCVISYLGKARVLPGVRMYLRISDEDSVLDRMSQQELDSFFRNERTVIPMPKRTSTRTENQEAPEQHFCEGQDAQIIPFPIKA